MHPTSQLALDLAHLDRRRMLRLLAGSALLPVLPKLAGCGSASGSGGGACDQIPEETAGPYPGDGSNGPNALALTGVVRSDIRSSIAGASATAAGVPLTVTLTIVDASSSACAPLSGYAVYLWHADRSGNYSMYSAAVSSENYLRGVQVSDADGKLSFTTIFPGCYDGRMPHIHFEVYASQADAVGGGDPVATSQLALPVATCNAVYATSGYEASVSNLAKISFDSDNVFSDGVDQQLVTVTGSVAAGLVATLTVPVSA